MVMVATPAAFTRRTRWPFLYVTLAVRVYLPLNGTSNAAGGGGSGGCGLTWTGAGVLAAGGALAEALPAGAVASSFLQDPSAKRAAAAITGNEARGMSMTSFILPRH